MYLEVTAAIKEADQNSNIAMLCLTGNGKVLSHFRICKTQKDA